VGPRVGLGVLGKRKISCSYVSGIDPFPRNVMFYVLVTLTLFLLLILIVRRLIMELILIVRRLVMEKIQEGDSLQCDRRSSDFTISGISLCLVF
jgi:hypothetical protein